MGQASPGTGGGLRNQATTTESRVINLMRVPGINQVLLQVRVAELDRTGLREIGADFLWCNPKTGTIVGTQIAGSAIGLASLLGKGGLTATASGGLTATNTAFGVFPTGNFELLIQALRQDSLVNILAEPNLTCMSGHRASFLAGGQIPIPVPQGGLNSAVTIQWQSYGVMLDFVPYVLENGVIRLTVRTEDSTLDPANGTTLTPGGQPVPAINTRSAQTTVELRQGETLGIAGLLQVEIDAQTSRIPGLGDLPYIGPMFGDTTHKRTEKELLVMVTPFLPSPMCPGEVPPMPGEDVKDPNDLEFYLLNRIEGRTGCSMPSTRTWDDPWGCVRRLNLEKRYVSGPVGYSE
jgi:pilus assembly protein CpaC